MDVTPTQAFPYFKLSYKETYKSETLKYDQLAMKYLSYVLYPLSLGFSVYSLLYRLPIPSPLALQPSTRDPTPSLLYRLRNRASACSHLPAACCLLPPRSSPGLAFLPVLTPTLLLQSA